MSKLENYFLWSTWNSNTHINSNRHLLIYNILLIACGGVGGVVVIVIGS